MKHLRVVLILIVLLLGIAGAAIFTANAGAPVGGNTLTPRFTCRWWLAASRRPLRALGSRYWKKDSRPRPARCGNSAMITARPPERINGAAAIASRSPAATAPGRSAAGRTASLSCGSAYPDNVATTMIYGPFSLADAKMAQMHFKLRYHQDARRGHFFWGASDGTPLRRAVSQRAAVRVDAVGP